jgi:hypothetical protein
LDTYLQALLGIKMVAPGHGRQEVGGQVKVQQLLLLLYLLCRKEDDNCLSPSPWVSKWISILCMLDTFCTRFCMLVATTSMMMRELLAPYRDRWP